jgi:TonB dependent receptor-like, beta-barrel
VGGRFRTAPRTGYLTGPDQEVDLRFVYAHTRGVLLGGFVQDSWSILDRVTLNVGLRYDSQTLYGPDGQTALAFPNEVSPRVGLVWDFTQQGRSKIYASYARYDENVPLDIADRAFGTTVALRGNLKPAGGSCNPRSRTTSACGSKENLLPGLGTPPNSIWAVGGATDSSPVDPALGAPTEDEWVAGIEYQVMPNTRVSLGYTHRHIVRWVEDMSVNGSGYFIGNPGEGIGSAFPSVRRVYDAVTVVVNKAFADLWLAQVSYTWQHLAGNMEGLFRSYDGQLDPNINTDFDYARLLVNRDGPLPGDVRHTIKAYLSKEFVILPVLSLTAGVAYVGSSGRPIDFQAASSFYGPGEVFVFPRGSGGRLPWQHTIDVNAAVNFRLASSTVLSVSINVFNLFNFQQVTRVSSDYTEFPQGAAPVPNGKPSTDRGKIVDDVTGLPLTQSQINPNFWHPVAYQPVRQIRFQARVTF